MSVREVINNNFVEEIWDVTLRNGKAKNILEKDKKCRREEKNVFMESIKTCGTEGVDCARLSNHLVYLQHTKNMFFMFILTRTPQTQRVPKKVLKIVFLSVRSNIFLCMASSHILESDTWSIKYHHHNALFGIKSS